MRSSGTLLCSVLLAFSSALAQAPPGGSGAGASSRAAALPPSGLNAAAGSVFAGQSATIGSGVNAISSSIQVSGSAAGSVPLNTDASGPITLSFADAVRRGLRSNLGTIAAADGQRQARAVRLEELSGLLPNISANLAETVTQVNLAAYGFSFKLPAGSNISIPSVVGPFSYSQAQVGLSQSLYDPVQRRNVKVARELERASAMSAQDERELVVLAVGGTYLQTLFDAARIASQQAQVSNAQAIYNQAVTRKAAGTNSKLDVMRSLVELQAEQQRLSSLTSDFDKEKIALARVIGVPLNRELVLSDTLDANETNLEAVSAALDQALRTRSDLRALEAQVRAAEVALSAAHAERYPSATLQGDYGVLGPNPANAHGVFAITGSVNIPVWQGGRVSANIEQAEATLHQRRAELANLREQIAADVRTASIDLKTADDQQRVASTNRTYAADTLAEARDRFTAGVGTTVEVVQAQQQVAAAEQDYLSSLFSLNLAKLNLARASGQAESAFTTLLKGSRP